MAKSKTSFKKGVKHPAQIQIGEVRNPKGAGSEGAIKNREKQNAYRRLANLKPPTSIIESSMVVELLVQNGIEEENITNDMVVAATTMYLVFYKQDIKAIKEWNDRVYGKSTRHEEKTVKKSVLFINATGGDLISDEID